MGLIDFDFDPFTGKKKKPTKKTTKKKTTKKATAKKTGKDTRRAFTQTQKTEILHQQDYKCAKCKNKLDLRATEFDHKKAWADKGSTTIKNGRALCKNCHGIVTHEERVKNVDESRKPTKVKKPTPTKTTMVTVRTLIGTKRIPKSKARRVKNIITGKMEWEEKLF